MAAVVSHRRSCDNDNESTEAVPVESAKFEPDFSVISNEDDAYFANNLVDTSQLSGQPECDMAQSEQQRFAISSCESYDAGDAMNGSAACSTHENDSGKFDGVADEDATATAEEDANKSFANELEMSGWQDVLGSGRLYRKILRASVSEDLPKPKNNEEVIVRLELKFADGAPIESIEKHAFRVGQFDVIEGLDICVQLMSAGELSALKIPSRLAYGERGRLPEIPPNTDLDVEVELLEIVPDSDSFKQNAVERLKIAEKKRERGNYFYGREEYGTAISVYQIGLSILNAGSTDSVLEQHENDHIEESLIKVCLEKSKIYNNLAAAQSKIEAWDGVLESTRQCLLLDAANGKALFRKAKALCEKDRLAESLEVLREALVLEPNSSAISLEISRVRNLIKQESRRDKELYTRMFTNTPGKSKRRKSSIFSKLTSTPSIIITSTVVGTIAVAALAYLGWGMHAKS